jgi:hypothetical protein
MVEFALLFHVPTSSAGMAIDCACACTMATPESRSTAMRDSMIGYVIRRYGASVGGRSWGCKRV